MVCNNTKYHYSRKHQRERVNVVLDPGNIVCLNGIENIASCAATIKEDGDYRVKITRTNEVGERINDSLTFECMFALDMGSGFVQYIQTAI